VTAVSFYLKKMSDSEENLVFSKEHENQEANQNQPPNQPVHYSPPDNNSEPDSDSDEDDNPVDMAVISALTNIKNCLRHGSFTKTSLVNFKQRNPSLIKVLITDGGDVTEVNDWLILLSDKIANLDEVSQSSCLNILLNIKIT
jgi:hypothetical protein